MKTSHPGLVWSTSGVRLLAPLAVLVTALPLSAAPATATPSAAADTPKTHTLFMGANLSVAQEREYFRVRDVDGSRLVITVKGQPVFVASKLTALDLKIEQSLKLSSTSAEVKGFKVERAYSGWADPKMKAQKRHVSVSTTPSWTRPRSRRASTSPQS